MKLMAAQAMLSQWHSAGLTCTEWHNNIPLQTA